MKTSPAFLFLIGLLAISCPRQPYTSADDQLEPGDPIAAIDGEPIYLGELNLVLTERLKVRDLDRLGIEVQQATAALLVRRHLAMKSLQQQGGDALESMINRQIETYAAELQRRGSSLQQQAESRMADEKALLADIAWRTAWAQYLRSSLNETNLRRFFQQHRDRYAGNRWQVSQIFVKMDTSDTEAVRAAAANLQKLADEIRATGAIAESFANAARQHSDSASAAEGGMVGWVEKDGDLPGSVMSEVRRTAAGQIGAPVQSPFGMHLILVHRAEPGQQTFDDLTDHAQLQRDAADALFNTLVARQSDAKVQWFVRALRPPPSVPIIPQ